MNSYAPLAYAPAAVRPMVMGQQGYPVIDVPRFTNVTAIGGMLLLSGSLAFMLASKTATKTEQIARGAAAAFGAYLVASQSQVRTTASGMLGDVAFPVLGLTAVAAALTGLGYWALKGKV
jgi:hypothetical protein